MTKKNAFPSDPEIAEDELRVDNDFDDLDESWLDRMHEFMRWQIIPPKASVPYGRSLSDSVLDEFIKNKDVLIRQIRMRGMIEGDELVMVAGLDPNTSRNLIIESEHPNISSLTRMDFHEYFIRKDVYKWIYKELDTAQAAYKDELSLRRKLARSKKKAARSGVL